MLMNMNRQGDQLMQHTVTLDSWHLSCMHHSQVVKNAFAPKTVAELKSSAPERMEAVVPGNFELDFIRAGKLPEDIFFGTNILETQKYENLHLWYDTSFCLEDRDAEPFLLFEGIDTAAEIYVDGNLLGTTENMLISHEFSLAGLTPGCHELVVHIIPAGIYSREFPLQPMCRSQYYNLDSLNIRKAPYMYGWDIMPRCVSAGLWRPVSLVYKSRNRISDYYIKVRNISANSAELAVQVQLHTELYQLSDLKLRVKGVCGDSVFEGEVRYLTHTSQLIVPVKNPRLWWPRNYGDPDLYETEIVLEHKGEVLDRVTCNFGLRTVQLERTSCAGENGTFHFKINGKKIFVLGTNWVPTDTFPSRHDEYTIRGLELVKDIGCNMIRCWGGNAYPGQLLFDYCDKNGILVWQDFSMACGIYPNDQRFCELLRKEAEFVVRQFRGHASLALWSGDNECDQIYAATKVQLNGQTISVLDPNNNVLTRKVLPDVIARLDGMRPYLPSSPYLDEAVFGHYYAPMSEKTNPAEDHLWGPRDYFKGDFYYTNSVCHFASETGYHGCPAPDTLKKIIGAENLQNYGDGKVCTDPHWLVHAASPETTPEAVYAYRIPLMSRQVQRLFGEIPENLTDYALESQISQAEAMKFFVEHFRIGKWYRTGLIWWNIIDGWPQISDAVVDWYGTKKLAYHYIKTSQTPFCMLCDEPDEKGNLTLCAANDTREAVTVNYTVTEALTGAVVAQGSCTVEGDSTARIIQFPETKGAYYRIQWTGDCTGENHFIGGIGDGVTLKDYVVFLKQAGYYEKLEGFDF